MYSSDSVGGGNEVSLHLMLDTFKSIAPSDPIGRAYKGGTLIRVF